MSSVLQLIRFVTDGLRDTIDSFATGALPLHRFAWEVQSRLDSLADLVDRRALAPLRSTQCIVATIDIALRESGRTGTTTSEKRILASALAAMRGELDRLTTTSLGTPARTVPLVTPAQAA
ncbi:hypothetical protein [Pseudonocardia acaciae]|uniref:hypothetical protein n=1 Tax=Pseudonocardia acaciae TaxID=551276 RepID=UPI00048C5CA7|nr:hypothetical protein [Pseudonocardia acaciae]